MAEFPREDIEFQAAVNARLTYIITNMAKWGLVPADLVPAQNGVGTFNTSFLNHQNLQAAALTGTQIKDADRFNKPAGAEPAMRALENRIEAHPACDNADRAALGIPIEGQSPPPPPEPSAPEADVDTSFALQHKVGWIDSLTKKRARPRNVRAAELWIAVVAAGAAQPPIESFVFLAQHTETPFLKNFASSDIGKTAYYALRWVMKDGSFGPWGEVVNATVVG